MARHWEEVGFGTPVVLYLFHVGKVLLYILFAWLMAVATTRGLAFTRVTSWYAEPIAFEKVVLYTMLFEVGLGCGLGPLNNPHLAAAGFDPVLTSARDHPVVPWPNRVPATTGTARTLVDVALYGLLLLLFLTLFADGTGPVSEQGTQVGLITTWRIVLILVVLGLRDKVIFLAARGEVMHRWR